MRVSLIIDRFEGEKVVLIDSKNTEIIWPKSKLPEEFKEGEALVFEISADTEHDNKSRAQAKDILNEILDIDNI